MTVTEITEMCTDNFVVLLLNIIKDCDDVEHKNYCVELLVQIKEAQSLNIAPIQRFHARIALEDFQVLITD